MTGLLLDSKGSCGKRGGWFIPLSVGLQMSDLGTIDFDVTMRPEKVVEVTNILLKEIKIFPKEGPTEKELAHIKKRYFFELIQN
ncbi:MAG: hypothetical protein Ct9H300mP23_10260 [Nitrospinota bacterium]|nr:MAG: hypothetical protein Ct9H300mP23_10260 [Nitrospinota bacterium]